MWVPWTLLTLIFIVLYLYFGIHFTANYQARMILTWPVLIKKFFRDVVKEYKDLPEYKED